MIKWTENRNEKHFICHTVNCCHTDVVRGQIKPKHPQEPSTSGSVDSAARLAATTRWWIPWCFGLLVQTGIISIWVTAVIVTIVSLPTLCRTTVWTLDFDKACSTMKFPQTHRGSFKNKQTNRSTISSQFFFLTYQFSPPHSSQAHLAPLVVEQGFLGLGGTPFSKTTNKK